MAGSRRALQDRGQRAGLDGDLRRTSRVDVVDRRREEHVDTLGLAERAVLLERARVAVEVLARAELQGVHEQRHDQGRVGTDLRARTAHQAGVALVHRAHRADEADALAAGAAGREQVGQLLAGAREHQGHGVPQMCSRGETGASTAGQRVVEHLTDAVRADRQHPAVGDDAVERGARHGDVRGQRVRRGGGDLGEVAADGADVAADDGAGQGGVALGQRVVESGVEQRAQGGGRVLGAGSAEQLHGLGDQGDEVVRAVGQTRVVERALVLGDEHRQAAEVADQPLGELALRRAGRDAVHAAAQAGQVDVGAGERHRRVHGDGAGTHRDGRGQHREAVAAAGVHDDLALPDDACGAEHGRDVVEHVVGDRQQQHVGRARDVGRLQQRYAGQQGRGPVPRGVGLAGDGDDLVAGGAEAGGQDGADTAGTDHAHTKGPDGSRHVSSNLSFQSRRHFQEGSRSGTRRLLLVVNTRLRGALPAAYPNRE